MTATSPVAAGTVPSGEEKDWEQRSNRMLLIGGRLVPARDGRTMEVGSPADGRRLGEVPRAGTADVDAAVAAAAAAFDEWRFADLTARRNCLLEFARRLRADEAALGHLDAVDSGNPRRAMRGDVVLAAMFIEYFAGLAFSWGGNQIPVAGRSLDFTIREPYGVTARIIPYNHPVLFAAWKIAAPLLTGNTVVLKLPDQTPLSGLRLAAILAEIFPPGVVNVLSGTGAEAGEALVRHPRVARVAFIGSVETGKHILATAAARVVPVTLELGGKNPMVVCPDVDLDAAMDAAVTGMNFSWCQGQSCGSYSRLFLHDAIHDEAVGRLIAKVRRLRVRHPLDDDADLGALVNQAALARSEEYVASALSDGAEVLTGGARPADRALANGCYFEPTVLAGVRQSMRVAREEIFGPVLSVLRWRTLNELLADVNATPFGLTGNVWTNDLDRAFYLAQRIEAGSIAVNGPGTQHWIGAPFGGCKESGIGREDGLEELLSTTREKNLNISLRVSRDPDEGGNHRGF